MEKQVAILFNEEVLAKAASLFNTDSKQSKKLGDFENYVFEVYRDDEPFILRLVHSSHRSEDQVEAELHWINFLSEHGVSIPKAFHSINGKFVEEIKVDDSYFYVSLFEKALGKPVKITDEQFNKQLFRVWGKTIGKMHKVAKEYMVAPGTPKRPDWHEEELLDIAKYISQEEAKVIEKTNDLVVELHHYSKDRDTYGIIHSDIHSGNYFYDGSQIHVFDFDDCGYHWFVSDIAIPLYYTVWSKLGKGETENIASFGKEFFSHFISGYLEENSITLEWLEKIPAFLRLRDITLYSVLHKKFDVSSEDDNFKLLLQNIKNRIEKEEPIIDLDYQALLTDVIKNS